MEEEREVIFMFYFCYCIEMGDESRSVIWEKEIELFVMVKGFGFCFFFLGGVICFVELEGGCSFIVNYLSWVW